MYFSKSFDSWLVIDCEIETIINTNPIASNIGNKVLKPLITEIYFYKLVIVFLLIIL